MLSEEIILRLVAGIGLLLLNAFFVTSEFALTRVRQFPEHEFHDHPGLQQAWDMTNELEIYLSGCKIGTTVTAIGLGLVAEPAITSLVNTAFLLLNSTLAIPPAVSVIVAFTLINLTHITLGEQVPTYLGVERSKTIAKHVSRPLSVWTKFFSPIIRGTDWVAKQVLKLGGVTITRAWTSEDTDRPPKSFPEIRREMGSLLSGTAIPRERQQEILNALDIGRLPVKDIMIPADDIVALNPTQSPDQAIETMSTAPHTRYPLRDGDTYVGLVYSSAIIRDLDEIQTTDKTIEDIAVPLPTISPTTPVSAVIDRFQAESQELALITETGEPPIHESEVLGLVTSTDAFEAITGDIDDPLDEDPGVRT